SIDRVIRMLIVHDIVEIDSGDTPLFDAANAVSQAEREQAAATRLFGLLPAPQAAAFRALWDEFEAIETPDARFAKALD
ncbi:HD domain-containing protein, partial [Acinetobacter baumannii]